MLITCQNTSYTTIKIQNYTTTKKKKNGRKQFMSVIYIIFLLFCIDGFCVVD